MSFNLENREALYRSLKLMLPGGASQSLILLVYLLSTGEHGLDQFNAGFPIGVFNIQIARP